MPNCGHIECIEQHMLPAIAQAMTSIWGVNFKVLWAACHSITGTSVTAENVDHRFLCPVWGFVC